VREFGCGGPQPTILAIMPWGCLMRKMSGGFDFRLASLDGFSTTGRSSGHQTTAPVSRARSRQCDILLSTCINKRVRGRPDSFSRGTPGRRSLARRAPSRPEDRDEAGRISQPFKTSAPITRVPLRLEQRIDTAQAALV
jgi:hypothetical protein